jgi:hypothetical protein
MPTSLPIMRPANDHHLACQAVLLARSSLALERTHSVVVPEIHERGARLRGRDLPRRGERVLVNFGETGLFGTVAWRSPEECEVIFDRRLEPGQSTELRQESIRARW